MSTLDAGGNPTKVQTTRGTTDTYDAYEYDARSRLTASCYGVAAGASNCSGAANAITYVYDKVSNRTQEVRSGNVGNTGTIDYSYNASDQLTSTIKSGQPTNYTYDANGNEASIGARTFTYDLADRLISTTSGGATTTYGYDGDDRRVSSTIAGGADLRYVWDPFAESGIAEFAVERTPSGSAVRTYLDGPLGATSVFDGIGRFYYHGDALGTVTDMTDASGSAQWKYEYEAYGAERTTTNVSGTAPENNLRFAGGYRDAASIQYNLRARQYDASSGRFGGIDPVENRLFAPKVGAYGYVEGRPTILIDPKGLFGVPKPPGWDGFTHGVKAAVGATKDVGVGTVHFANETAATVGKYTNPVTGPYHILRGVGERGYNTFKGCRKGLRACYDASNENLNPMFSVVVAGDQCIFHGGITSRTYNCLSAGRDTALAAFGVTAVARLCLGSTAAEVGGTGLSSRIGERLADERGSIGGPSPGNLKRLSDSELKRTVGDPHAFKEGILGTDKNLSEWDVHRADNQLYLVTRGPARSCPPTRRG